METAALALGSKGRVARFHSRYRTLRCCAPDRAASYTQSIFSKSGTIFGLGASVVRRAAILLGVLVAGCHFGFALNPALDVQYVHDAWTVRGGFLLGCRLLIAFTISAVVNRGLSLVRDEAVA